MRSRYGIFKNELVNAQGHSAKDVDRQITQLLNNMPKVNQTYQPSPAIKNTLPQLPPPKMNTGTSPIEEARKVFLLMNPDIKDLFGLNYKSNWFQYLKRCLDEIKERCKSRICLPKPPMRSVYGISFIPQETIQWEGNDQWAPDLDGKLNYLERYYTECIEFEIKEYSKNA